MAETANIIAYQGGLRLHNWIDNSRSACKVTFNVPFPTNPFRFFTARDADHAGQRYHVVLMFENEVAPAWEGELLLLGWNSSGNTGHTVTFMVAPDDGGNPFAVFESGKNGVQFVAVFVELNDDEMPVIQPPEALPNPKKEIIHKQYGLSATLLYRTGWLIRDETLSALGGIDAFRLWARQQPCCITADKHDSRVLARTLDAEDPYSIAPVCFLHKLPNAIAKSWQRKYAMQWARETLCDLLGAEDGLGSINPQELVEWARENDVHHKLPSEYTS